MEEFSYTLSYSIKLMEIFQTLYILLKVTLGLTVSLH